MKIGDLIASYGGHGDPWLVVAINGNAIWSRKDDSEHLGCLESRAELIDADTRVIEPIPEPKIEVSREYVVVRKPGIPYIDRSEFVADITRTDGKITAVELVKDQS